MAKMTQAEILNTVKRGVIDNNRIFSVLKFLKPKKEKQIENGFILELKLNQNYRVLKTEDGWKIKMITGSDRDIDLCPKNVRNIEELVIVINGFDQETRGVERKRNEH